MKFNNFTRDSSHSSFPPPQATPDLFPSSTRHKRCITDNNCTDLTKAQLRLLSVLQRTTAEGDCGLGGCCVYEGYLLTGGRFGKERKVGTAQIDLAYWKSVCLCLLGSQTVCAPPKANSGLAKQRGFWFCLGLAIGLRKLRLSKKVLVLLRLSTRGFLNGPEGAGSKDWPA